MSSSSVQIRSKFASAPLLGVAALCILPVPVLYAIATYAKSNFIDWPFTLFLAAASLAATLVGFVTGPITLIWCVYLVGTIVISGLSGDQQYSWCCTSKNGFEAGLVSLVPALMFPGSAISTYVFWSLLVSKRRVRTRTAALVALASTLAAFGALMYLDHLEKSVPCSAVRCNFR